jgi:septum formation protein
VRAGRERGVPLILASGSPRRRDLLEAAGIACVVDPVHVDEARLPDEPPRAYAERLAREKALAGAARHPGEVVLGADTIVVVGDTVLGKPADEAGAREMLGEIGGRAHEVLTAVALVRDGRILARVERTVVWVRPVSAAEIDWWLAAGEHADKAGAYAIQGRASCFIPRIDGSYTNVVGLPVAAVVEMLAEMGVRPEAPA